MVDALAGLGEETPASAETPAASTPDIEALKAQLKAELSSEYDQRISGLQTALNRKDAEAKQAAQRARDLEMSGMSQDEKDAMEWQQKDEQIASLTRANELLKLQGEYPDLVPLYEKMLEAPDVRTQLGLLASLRKQQAQAAASNQSLAPEQEPDIPDIDPNNPSTPPAVGATYGGQTMTDDIADRILGAFRRLPTGR